MRISKPVMHVFKIGAQLCRNIVIAIALSHHLQILCAALLRDLQTLPQSRRQHRQTIRNHVRQNPCALTAAGHKHAQQTLLGKLGEILFAQGQHLRPDRIADQVDLVIVFVFQPLNLRIGCRNRINAARKQAIDPPQNRILLVNYAGDFGRGCRGKRWKSRIATEADNRARLKALKQTQRHAPPLHDGPHPANPFQGILTNPPRWQNMRRQRLWPARDCRTALISDQSDMMPARLKLARQGEGWQ